MAFRSSGTLEQDIKDIGIKQMGKSEYNELNDGAKKLLDSYAKDLVGALKAFIMRQEFHGSIFAGPRLLFFPAALAVSGVNDILQNYSKVCHFEK